MGIQMNGILGQDSASLSPYASGREGIRILFVEDDEDYREALGADLSERGFVVHSFADATSLLDSFDNAVEADVIILDWKLPKTSGIDLLGQLRRQGVNLPVVFLTGLASTVHETLAFERGAIDFIDKTRGVDVLGSRLKCIVGSHKPIADRRADKFIACGKLVLKPEIGRAYWNDVDVGLTIGEYRIVHLLATNAGRYITYRSIYDCLTYEGFIAGVGNTGYRTNVRSAIRRIRNKFRACDPAFGDIENYTAFGYCWGSPAGDPKKD
jgi:two-component system, OmpR family, response regulator ChvI